MNKLEQKLSLVQATGASEVSYALDRIKNDISALSQELEVSEVLILTCVRQWAEDQLVTVIDAGG
jgi:hypothetical protein